MSAMEQLTAMMEKISMATAEITKMQAQLPALIQALDASAPAKSAKAVKAVKAVKAEADAEAEAEAAGAKPKKPASDGTMAWHAFVSHVQKEQPSRFAEMKKHSDVLHEAKAIREEDEDAYKTFIASWKAERLASAPEPSASVEEVVVVKEKKKVAAGTMAWHAFVAHCKTIMPELESMGNAEKLQAIKARKENDKTGYESFVAEWKAVQA